MKTLLILIFAFFISSAAQDYLEFRNGETANVTILDTSDCFVTFERNGNKVSLNKDMFKFIIFWEDTTDLSSYTCKNNIRKNIPASINYRDFLYSKIQSLGVSKKPRIAKGSKIAVCNAILSEAIDNYSWDLFKDEIANRLDKSVTFLMVPLENCANLDSMKKHFDYLITFNYDKQSDKNYFKRSNMIGIIEMKKFTTTTEIAVVNLKSSICEYKKTLQTTAEENADEKWGSPEDVRNKFAVGYHKAKAKSIHNHMSNINRLIRRQ